MAARLHLITLGTPQLLTESGEHIRFKTRKHFALLIRLAIEQGRSFARDYLMDLLWTDASETRAGHSLAQALSVLRGLLGGQHVLRRRETIGLAAGVLDLDIDRLDSSEVGIRGPFLDGFDVPDAVQFAHWKDEWHAKLLPRMRDCLVRQMLRARRVGDFATIERWAATLLELDPFSEDAVRGLMVARAWVGDRTNALAVYNELVGRLAAELGTKPSSDLTRIAELFREGRRPRVPEPLVSGRVAEQRAERRFDPEMVIGREPEFARLSDAWLEARGGLPRIAVLLGDSGVGKTTLANAFVSACQMDGAVVARAQSYEAERELPFAVLAELVKQLAIQRAIGGADFEALSELARISPEILSAFPGVPKPIDWSAEVIPLRLADSFLKAVEAATESRPLVLVVDDIHAADNASAAILHITARKLPPARLLVVLTARTNELRAANTANAFVNDLTIQAIDTVELEPLQAPAAEELIAAIVARSGQRGFDVPVSRILQASNGYPLAIELLTKEWLAHGSSSLLRDLEAVDTQPAANLGIPRAINAVFERQIRRLDPPVRAGLHLAAVLGRRLGDLQMYEAVDLPAAAAGEALSRLRDSGFLREVHGGLEFRNELIRAQAYYAVAGPARRHLHRRIAERLAECEAKDGHATSLEIAWHFLRGGDVARALPSGLEGAEAAMRVGAPLEAEELLTALLAQTRAANDLRRARLLLSKALLQQSKGSSAKPLLKGLGRESDMSLRDTAELRRMEATAEYLLNEEGGVRYAETAGAALAAARRTTDLELIGRALFEYARSGVNSGNQELVATAREQSGLILAENPSRAPAMLFYTKAYCDFCCYELESAAAALEKAIQLLDAHSDPAELSLLYSGYGTCKHGLCEFAAAANAYVKALELSRRIGDDPRSSIIASNICAVRLHQGDYESAVHFGQHAVHLGTRSLSPRLVAVHLNLAASLLMSGQASAARQSLNAAQQASQTEHSWIARIEFLLGSASLNLAAGDRTRALELIEATERLAWSRERAVSNAGLFDKLRIFRAAHVSGPSTALAISLECREKYRNRYPFYYLDAIACTAWVEKQLYGHCSEESLSALKMFDLVGASGLRSILSAQGFLS